MGRAKTLLIPARLCVIILGAGASACGSSLGGSMSDGGLDAADATDGTRNDAVADAKRDVFVTEAGCTAPTPKGRVCVTHCLQQEATEAPIPFKCDVFCDLPVADASTTTTFCYDTDGGVDEDDCMRTMFADGGSQVLC
jgi:hypothetical protein